MTRGRAVALVAVPVALAALWGFPFVVFPSPGPNDAPWLWTLPIPVVGLTLAASFTAVGFERRRRRPAAASVALGTYMAGVAVAFLIGLLTVANLTDDRFWPFLVSPVVFGPAGLVLVLAGVVGRSVARSEVFQGTLTGAVAALFLLVWMLARGSRDWLLAPYGFDICLLISLEAVVVFIAGGSRASIRTIRSA